MDRVLIDPAQAEAVRAEVLDLCTQHPLYETA